MRGGGAAWVHGWSAAAFYSAQPLTSCHQCTDSGPSNTQILEALRGLDTSGGLHISGHSLVCHSLHTCMGSWASPSFAPVGVPGFVMIDGFVSAGRGNGCLGCVQPVRHVQDQHNVHVSECGCPCKHEMLVVGPHGVAVWWVVLCRFGQPRVGNPAFANALAQVVNSWRLVNNTDLVRLLPF